VRAERKSSAAFAIGGGASHIRQLRAFLAEHGNDGVKVTLGIEDDGHRPF
jgi:hypothetical protein